LIDDNVIIMSKCGKIDHVGVDEVDVDEESMLITLMECMKQNARDDDAAAAAVRHATVDDKHVENKFLNTIMTVLVKSMLMKTGLHWLLTHLPAIER